MSERTLGREPVVIVQIDQDFCELTHGVAPCNPAPGFTRKCFNTRATCQDPENYTKGVRTLTFCRPQDEMPLDDVYTIPSVRSVDTSPTVLNPGAGGRDSGPLGQRATVKVQFDDHPHNDNWVDPYVDSRDYDPFERGTFWSKWLARNPYYNNREIRVYEGYKGQALHEMRRRTYLIDKLDGPTNGRVTITGKDILKLADDKRAQVPRVSTGELIEDISESATTLRITGAVAADYPAPGTVRVNDELMTYTTVTTISETEIQLTGITRGTDGSEGDAHSEGDRVQLCARYENVRCDLLAYEWLVDYASVPAAYIDSDAWDAEASVWLQQFSLTGLVTEPTGVTSLLGEITEQCLFYIWWDERAQLIRLEAIKPPVGSVPRITDDDNIIGGSPTLKAKPDSRVSQVWVFWGQRNPTKKLDEESNFRRLRVRADLEAESDTQYNEQRVRKIFSRWLVNEGQAINITTRLLSRYRNNPRFLTIDVDAKDRALWTGSVLDVLHRGVVDETGSPELMRWQIISADEIESGHKMRYELEVYEYAIGVRAGNWMDASAPDYEDASDEEKLTGFFWADEEGFMPNGDAGYNWQ